MWSDKIKLSRDKTKKATVEKKKDETNNNQKNKQLNVCFKFYWEKQEDSEE